MSEKYILDGKTPVVEPNLHKWAKWLETHLDERVVAKTDIGDARVSTVKPPSSGPLSLWFSGLSLVPVLAC